MIVKCTKIARVKNGTKNLTFNTNKYYLGATIRCNCGTCNFTHSVLISQATIVQEQTNVFHS